MVSSVKTLEDLLIIFQNKPKIKPVNPPKGVQFPVRNGYMASLADAHAVVEERSRGLSAKEMAEVEISDVSMKELQARVQTIEDIKSRKRAVSEKTSLPKRRTALKYIKDSYGGYSPEIWEEFEL
jgi:hypothetical protein